MPLAVVNSTRELTEASKNWSTADYQKVLDRIDANFKYFHPITVACFLNLAESQEDEAFQKAIKKFKKKHNL